jgi:hypothetical protein
LKIHREEGYSSGVEQQKVVSFKKGGVLGLLKALGRTGDITRLWQNIR